MTRGLARKTMAVAAVAAAVLAGASTGASAAEAHASRVSATQSHAVPKSKLSPYDFYKTEGECEAAGKSLIKAGETEFYSCQFIALNWWLYIYVD
jgi:hypothetical protein